MTTKTTATLQERIHIVANTANATLTIAECIALAALYSWRDEGARTRERLDGLVTYWAGVQYGPYAFEPVAATIAEARALAMSDVRPGEVEPGPWRLRGGK